MKNILLVLSLLVFSNSCFGQDKKISNDNIFYPVEKYPQFPGGETELYKFIQDKLYYPHSAFRDSIQGRVIIRFMIRKTGDIDSVRLIRGIHPDCDKIAMNIVKAMPKWSPGNQMGEVVDVWFTLPIIFKLPEIEIVSPEQLPSFPGAEQALFKFIAENLKYHGCSEGPCPQGRVTIRFIVTKEGKIEAPEIIRGITPTLDNEAIRIVSIMPKWIPAKHKGKNVDAYFTLPIVFRLE